MWKKTMILANTIIDLTSKIARKKRCLPASVVTCDPNRYAHSDIPFPDFKDMLKKDKKPLDTNENQKCLTYGVSFIAGVTCMYGLKSHVLHYLMFLAPSRDVLATAQSEATLTNIPEGKVAIVKWRGKPVFLYHRSQNVIDQEREVDVSILRDPIPNSGMIPGGFFCPCHGSHYDGAGRVRKGPAPLNLPVHIRNSCKSEVLLIKLA